MAEIYEIRDENERLRSQLRELTSSDSSSKIIPIRSSQASEVISENVMLQTSIKDKKAISDSKESEVNNDQ